jgi:ATP-dependent DNA helicase RecG
MVVRPSLSPPVRYKGRVYVKVGPTTRVATEDEERQLAGRLADVLRRLEELLEINVSTRTTIDAQSREIRHPDYPVVALKQLAHNAIMHRSYDGTNAPVQVY